MIRRPGTGPVTLTRGQFAQTAAGKKPGARYEGYLAYIDRRRNAKLQQPNTDPFAPTSPNDINSAIGKFTSMYGNPLTDPEISAKAQGMIDPVVAALTSRVNDRARQATEAIKGYSGDLAGELAGLDLGAPYTQAKTEQAAVDSVLHDSLAGAGGTGVGEDLSSRLAAINDPTVAAAASGLADRGAALGTTELARGSSNLGSLIASAAAAREYGAKLPGLAKLSGLQDISGVQRTATGAIADQTAELEKLVPGLVQGFRSENAALRGNKASIAAQIYGLLTGQNVTKATAKAGLAGDQASLDYQYANANADAQAAADTLAERQRHDKAIEGGKTQLTPAVREKAIKAIDLYYYGEQPKQHYDGGRHAWVEVPGTGTPAINYHTAISNLVNGYGLSQEQATALANTRYKPGEDGRPMTTQQKTAAASAPAHTRETDARAAAATGKTKPAPPANPNSWDPKKDPIVAPGPPGTGTARTRSGRYVDVNFGAYVNAPGA